MAPVLGFTKPATAFRSVDFPQPEGPISAVKELGARSIEVGSSATEALPTRPRNVIDTSSISTNPRPPVDDKSALTASDEPE